MKLLTLNSMGDHIKDDRNRRKQHDHFHIVHHSQGALIRCGTHSNVENLYEYPPHGMCHICSHEVHLKKDFDLSQHEIIVLEGGGF